MCAALFDKPADLLELCSITAKQAEQIVSSGDAGYAFIKQSFKKAELLAAPPVLFKALTAVALLPDEEAKRSPFELAARILGVESLNQAFPHLQDLDVQAFVEQGLQQFKRPKPFAANSLAYGDYLNDLMQKLAPHPSASQLSEESPLLKKLEILYRKCIITQLCAIPTSTAPPVIRASQLLIATTLPEFRLPSGIDWRHQDKLNAQFWRADLVEPHLVQPRYHQAQLNLIISGFSDLLKDRDLPVDEFVEHLALYLDEVRMHSTEARAYLAQVLILTGQLLPPPSIDLQTRLSRMLERDIKNYLQGLDKPAQPGTPSIPPEALKQKNTQVGANTVQTPKRASAQEANRLIHLDEIIEGRVSSDELVANRIYLVDFERPMPGFEGQQQVRFSSEVIEHFKSKTQRITCLQWLSWLKKGQARRTEAGLTRPSPEWFRQGFTYWIVAPAKTAYAVVGKFENGVWDFEKPVRN